MAVTTQLKISILAALLHERASVLEQMDATAEDFRASKSDGDGVPSSDYERDEIVHSHLSGRLSEIDDALRRLESGTYGVCTDCWSEIPPARLRAKPSASLCVPCQARRERQRARWQARSAR